MAFVALMGFISFCALATLAWYFYNEHQEKKKGEEPTQ
jgi:hypothetical protein